MADSFQVASAQALKLKTPPTNDEKLNLYGLYKQALKGDNKTAQPWAIQVKPRAKWEAWTKHKGLSQAEARNKYVQLVNQLVIKYGLE
jgi:diazepam-binding inhibitor (GABA receptor modulating acyl-CoA-binding protein)